MYGSIIVALGTNYMVNRSTNSAVNTGLWMIGGGFLLMATSVVLATDSPRGVHTLPGRVVRAVGRALPCTRPTRRGGADAMGKPRLVASAGADPEAGRSHTVRVLLPQGGASSRGGSGRGGGRGPDTSSSDVVLERFIGAGSFASVFRARYAGAPCAVKVLSATSHGRRAAAKAEAELSLSLRHPCVLATFAVLDVDVPTAALTDAADARGKTGSPESRLSLNAASAALAEFAAVLQAAPDASQFTAGDGGGDGNGGGGGDGGGTGGGAGAGSWPSASVTTASSTTVPQTWIVQQLADQGTLEHAIRTGMFERGPSAQPALPASSQAGTAARGGSRGSGSDGAVASADQPPPTAAGLRPSPTGNATTPSPDHPAAWDARTSRRVQQRPKRRPRLLRPPNPVAALLATLKDVASGLAYLHAVGIVHGDLKAANVLLTSRSGCPSGRRWAAVIADFGLSRVLALPPGVSSPSPAPQTHILTHTFGTAAYTAPEIVREGRLSAKSDVYALAILCWEAWTGQEPYRHMPHAASIFYRVGIEGRRPPLDERFEAAPPGYVDLIQALWEDAAHARPTAADAARALGAMLEAELAAGGGGVAAAAGGRPPSPHQPRPPEAAVEE